MSKMYKDLLGYMDSRIIYEWSIQGYPKEKSQKEHRYYRKQKDKERAKIYVLFSSVVKE